MDKVLSFLTMCIIIISCKGQSQQKKESKNFPISKTEEEWKSELSEMQYFVLIEAGTERPFTGAYYNHKEEGIYVCAACKSPLYESKYKYNSGTGWPSFDRAVEGSVVTSVDYKIGYARNELLCSQCGGHLGHVFGDGPRETTGKRHCINSVSLEFKPTKN